ncbi:MAG: mechanosensitive ion channel [Kangiellaceae bacterium]|nr:mechanosensitive ion channel [Kangiellaceae bacterium]
MYKILQKPLFSLSEDTSITLWQLILAVVFIILAWLFSHFVARFIGRKILSKTDMAQDNIIVIQRLIFFLLLSIIIVTALSFLHVPFTAFAFISGAIAIGLGFGAKNVMDNFISGWILMSERPVRIGDFIELDDVNRGKVIRVGNRSTMIKRTDGAHMIIPNSDLLQTRLINWTLIDDNIRTSFKVGVAYGSDVKLVTKILNSILEEHTLVLPDPKPAVMFEDFADSALVFEIWFWAVVSAERELRSIRSDLRYMIERRFSENDIIISFPQRDVHLHIHKSIPVHISNNKERRETVETISDKFDRKL